ncbi:hypothetical protein N8J89_12845 [Crossiella sp. CA-258035]|uniref:hypothetical protein n=1 Tax=Crossiella sp. CA-258035 TaxID=2981138 RepID=UPI0024BD20F3|nr:hypothetical protein [Crossiella sp. CA-258035]WHT21908.1 hypothetical protein N8J89_12845 [Crossiella sp. CA-258035]
MTLPTAALRAAREHLNHGLGLLSTRHLAHPPADLAEASEHLRYLVFTLRRLFDQHADEAGFLLSRRDSDTAAFTRAQLHPVQRVLETAQQLRPEHSIALFAVASGGNSYRQLERDRRTGHLERLAPFPADLRVHLDRTDRPSPATRQAIAALAAAEDAGYVATGNYGHTRPPAKVSQSMHEMAEVYRAAAAIAELMQQCAWHHDWSGRNDVPLATHLDPVRQYWHKAKTALGVQAAAATEHSAALLHLGRALPGLATRFWG